jgi:hypothetical protein
MTRRTLGGLLLDGLDEQGPAKMSVASSWSSLGSMDVVFSTFPKRYPSMDRSPGGGRKATSLRSELLQRSEPRTVLCMAAPRLAASRP